jgi:uncharacterized protein YdaU (DUF1376 family)
MSERPDTWMPIYWGDYLKDTGHLGAAEHGAYLLMIGHYWCTGEPLPNSDPLLAKITRQALGKWRGMREVLAAFFEINEGGWHHHRVEEEMASAIERKGKAQARAEHAARTRWGKSKHAPSMPAQCPSSSPSPLVPIGTRANKGSRLPENWSPSEEELKYAAEQGCVDPKDTAERFKLHHQNKGTVGKNWRAGFQYWCRNEKNFSRKTGAYADRFGKPETHIDGASEWSARLRGWHQSKFWQDTGVNSWGPRPGSPDCLVPPHLLKDAA